MKTDDRDTRYPKDHSVRMKGVKSHGGGFEYDDSTGHKMTLQDLEVEKTIRISRTQPQTHSPSKNQPGPSMNDIRAGRDVYIHVGDRNTGRPVPEKRSNRFGWVTWVFSGIGVFILGLMLSFFDLQPKIEPGPSPPETTLSSAKKTTPPVTAEAPKSIPVSPLPIKIDKGTAIFIHASGEDAKKFQGRLYELLKLKKPPLLIKNLPPTVFNPLLSGEVQNLSTSDVFRETDYLTVGELDLSFYQRSKLDKDLITCEAYFQYKTWSSNDEIISMNSFISTGAGFSRSDAAMDSIEKLVNSYGDKLLNIN